MLTAAWGALRLVSHVQAAEDRSSRDPNAACAGCHREIYDRYRKTPMANGSGPAADGFIAGDFLHKASGVRYRVYEEDGKVWLSYERPGHTAGGSDRMQVPRSAQDEEKQLSGRQELIYFLGSGKRGRTYLFEQDGYWFEAPINWYAKKKLWDMAPAYQDGREMPLTLPVDPGCLHCHASGVASSLPDARNHYAGAPFAEGGITCAACHGDGAAHVASGGKVKMLEIDALPGVRRDSVCLNCHLEGQVGVMREGKRPEDFRPGDDLFDYSVFFVHRGEKGSGGRATSQYEALLKSQCWRQSGGKLTCTTCHDPHGGPAPEQKVEFYRAKCLQCHAALAANHHAENRDCTACHMARPPTNDIAHEQETDHWIRRRVSEAALPLAATGDLVTVGPQEASGRDRDRDRDRDLGLAYAQLAEHGDRQAGERALVLLRKAEIERGAAQDQELHAQLGFLLQETGDSDAVAGEYRAALKEDEYDAVAGGNLALIQAEAHRYGEATRLWQKVFTHDPAELGAGFNLAVVECGEGEKAAALETLERILKFSPDSARARSMAEEIRGGGKCGKAGTRE